MKHGKKFNHLSRPASHRKALLSNQAKSLILHKRIMTTVAKAKALRKSIEPIITQAKNDSTHARRMVFAYFQDKEPVKLLFDEVIGKIGTRPGGYTRIIKTGTRLGDNAAMCMIELVDYNQLYQKETHPQKTKTRRGKSKGKSLKPATGEQVAEDLTALSSEPTNSAQVLSAEPVQVMPTTPANKDTDEHPAAAPSTAEADKQ